MAKRISENEKTEIIDDFLKNKTLEEISEKFNFTKVTITRHLKRSLGEKKFNELNKNIKNSKQEQDLGYSNTSHDNLEKTSEGLISDYYFNERRAT